ncbi:MAG: ABC transporter permease [Xanthomonadales bacterium]|nr:ABC transporter permease [Xanthomonadales bacterium]
MNNQRVEKPRSGVGTWIDHHLYSLMASLGRVLRKPFASLLTIAVIALAFTLPLGLWLVLQNVERFTGDVQRSREISVFLKQDTPVDRARALAEEVRARPDVGNVVWKTPDEGLAELRKSSTLGDVLDGLDGNPLPNVLVVTPKRDELALADALKQFPEADLVQHDAVWRKRLDDWLQLGARLALVLAVMLGAGAVLVIGNTVRLDIQARREEIGVLQLLGATDGFIRRPFLYLGALYGLGAGLLALAVLTAANIALRPPLSALAASYGSHFELQPLTPAQALAAVVAATLLGWLGAGIVTGHFLRQTRPTDR